MVAKNTEKQRSMASREEWRAWLEENHATEKALWLVLYKKHTTRPGITYEEAVEEALCFGWIDGLMRGVDGESYVLRFSPRKRGSNWSESNKQRVERLIEHGRMAEAGLAMVRAAQENGEWDKVVLRGDLSETPVDLRDALQAHAPAWSNFERFAPSYRKQFVGWISSARTETTRQKRIEETVRRAAENRKLGQS